MQTLSYSTDNLELLSSLAPPLELIDIVDGMTPPKNVSSANLQRHKAGAKHHASVSCKLAQEGAIQLVGDGHVSDRSPQSRPFRQSSAAAQAAPSSIGPSARPLAAMSHQPAPCALHHTCTLRCPQASSWSVGNPHTVGDDHVLARTQSWPANPPDGTGIACHDPQSGTTVAQRLIEEHTQSLILNL